MLLRSTPSAVCELTVVRCLARSLALHAPMLRRSRMRQSTVSTYSVRSHRWEMVGSDPARFEAPWAAKFQNWKETLTYYVVGPSTPRASTGLAGRGWCGDPIVTCPASAKVHALPTVQNSTITLAIPPPPRHNETFDNLCFWCRNRCG